MKEWLPLVGVIIAQVVILSLFVLKQRADDQRRWHERRLELYASFVGLLTTQQAEVHSRRDQGIEPNQDSWPADANTERVTLLNQIALLGSDFVYEMALEWGAAVKKSSEQQGHGKPKALAVDHRRNFLNSVRDELGVRSPGRSAGLRRRIP